MNGANGANGARKIDTGSHQDVVGCWAGWAKLVIIYEVLNKIHIEQREGYTHTVAYTHCAQAHAWRDPMPIFLAPFAPLPHFISPPLRAVSSQKGSPLKMYGASLGQEFCPMPNWLSTTRNHCSHCSHCIPFPFTVNTAHIAHTAH
jgi:hypothetical protein